ncbi:beta-galactosidase GalB [Natronoflexus pectinivorans]|uniref:Beta-galactosidase n=1 Tax=Natronoflexus pectinivorans TaxID=682526 RepID=A0A4R2GBL9_9BACT|nr:beta-galactosidase GalB [Natronoflexus pectinivorans]TCO05425.1 beta-galactosidase [Natronoflexus pectinivorans]
MYFFDYFKRQKLSAVFVSSLAFILLASCTEKSDNQVRERLSINDGWRFFRYDDATDADGLIYDVRPDVDEDIDQREADDQPVEGEWVEGEESVLKAWILPSGNDFIKDPAKRHVRPEGYPGFDFPFVQAGFDDGNWEKVNLPHDWGAREPFTYEVSGSMGRLPSHGVAWYRRSLDIPSSDSGRQIYLEVEGAMSYAMVWLNGHLVGGWPYGYNSWQLDLTPYIIPGGENQLAIRLDNPPISSRWYPGGGIYRNMWIIKTEPIHVGQWGTFITTRDVSEESAVVDLEVTIDNKSNENADVEIVTFVYELDSNGNRTGNRVIEFAPQSANVAAKTKTTVNSSVTIANPRLWGPLPTQIPNRYLAVTEVQKDGKVVDVFETPFGIRSLEFDPVNGLFVNSEHIYIKGVNQHHDLGPMGTAFNKRAAERQLEILREAGVNSIRMAHNPPAPELLELTDKMGFLVVNEVFDVWERRKVPFDFHLIFPDWYEQDLRAMVRRDRNHPSVIMWSYGNEVGEQYTGDDGAALSQKLNDILKDEDPTRPTTASMNFAKPDMPMPATMDIISLNYQGEGIRIHPGYEHLQGIRTHPLYTDFHEAFPNKMIISSENAAALSIRGEYLFPVTPNSSAPVSDGIGGDSENLIVCAYELYTANFGSSVDRVFAAKAQHPFVAGGFVWSGWDYLGEPTPYYDARSTYFGIVDLAGFKKNRFYLYQSHWHPELPMAHILPHWNWPDRVGKVTPVHVFTSGDEAELFLNGESLGRKKKGDFEYRLRWDDVIYEPGELKVVAYKNGEEWAQSVVKTTGAAESLNAEADRDRIKADGKDLSFVTISVTDEDGLVIPDAKHPLRFSIEGPGEIVATDSGDPRDFVAFPSNERNAFNGLSLVIVRGIPDKPGTIRVHAESDGLKSATVEVQTHP